VAFKAAADILCLAYYRSFNLDVVIVRPTNNFGPYQFPEKLIPKTIIRTKLGLKVPIYGSGRNVRDWLYVSDTCKAIDLILKEGKAGEIYNLSAGNELENVEVERNRIALSLITNTRYKHIILLHTLGNTATTTLRARFKSSASTMARALFDGTKLGRKLKSRGIRIDIYKAPIIKIPIKDLGVFFTTKRAVRKYVREYFKDWALKNLNSLSVE